MTDEAQTGLVSSLRYGLRHEQGWDYGQGTTLHCLGHRVTVRHS
jgi:hypothetical protein